LEAIGMGVYVDVLGFEESYDVIVGFEFFVA
jgi:hypothetical protein